MLSGHSSDRVQSKPIEDILTFSAKLFLATHSNRLFIVDEVYKRLVYRVGLRVYFSRTQSIIFLIKGDFHQKKKINKYHLHK